MKLYVFPALLPLAGLAPWVIGLIGTGAAILVSFAAKFRGRKRWALAFLAAVALVILIGAIRGRRGATVPKGPEGPGWSLLFPRSPISNLGVYPKAGLLLFGTQQGTLEAVAWDGSRAVYSIPMGEPVVAEPLIHRNRLYVGTGIHSTQQAMIASVDLEDGIVLWRQRIAGHIEERLSLSADGETLFGCSGESGVFALRAKSGEWRWRQNLGHCDGVIQVEPNRLALLTRASAPASVESPSRLITLNPADGKVLSSLDLPGMPWGNVTSEPVTKNWVFSTGVGQVSPMIESGEKSWIHSVDPRSFKLLWSREIPGFVLPDLLFGDGRIGVTLKLGELWTMNPSNGEVLTRARLGAPIVSAPRSPDGREAWALAFDGTVHVIDLRTGQKLRGFRGPSESTSSPLFEGPWVFLAGRGGLYAQKVVRP